MSVEISKKFGTQSYDTRISGHFKIGNFVHSLNGSKRPETSPMDMGQT